MQRTVTIADVQTDVDDLSDQEKHLLGHIDNLSARINEATAMLEQLHAARENFSGKLIHSRTKTSVDQPVPEVVAAS